jgi:hypothetical protein
MSVTSYSIDICLALNSLEWSFTKNYSDTAFHRIQNGQSSCSEFQTAQKEPNAYVSVRTDLVKTSALFQ